MTKENMISIIIPTYKGEKSIQSLIENLISLLQSCDFEIIIVNDCSPDESTHKICLELCSKYSNKITYLKLSKNFGEHNAIMAGLRNCEGDLAIIMDDNGAAGLRFEPGLIDAVVRERLKTMTVQQFQPHLSVLGHYFSAEARNRFNYRVTRLRDAARAWWP